MDVTADDQENSPQSAGPGRIRSAGRFLLCAAFVALDHDSQLRGSGDRGQLPARNSAREIHSGRRRALATMGGGNSGRLRRRAVVVLTNPARDFVSLANFLLTARFGKRAPASPLYAASHASNYRTNNLVFRHPGRAHQYSQPRQLAQSRAYVFGLVVGMELHA